MTIGRRTFMGWAGTSAAASVLARPVLAQGRRAGTLVFVPSTNLVSLDPVFSTALVAVQHGYYVFDTLYGVNGKLEPKPQMAEGTQVSDDGRTATIALREGLKFHDGTPVRAADCTASLQRWSKRDTFGKLVEAVVDRYEVASDRVLKVHLKAPFPRLLDAIGKPHSSPAFMMPERLAKTPPTTQITEMVGCGPYRFLADQFDSGSRVAYARFADYVPRQEAPDWTSGGKIAHFDRVEWHVIPDQSTATAGLQAGEIDWLENISADLAPMFAKDKDVKIVTSDPLGTIPVMRFNCTVAPFDNRKLRELVARIVDQSEYLATVAGDNGKREVCRAMFPCTIGSGAETGKDVIGSLVGKPAEIKAALKEAGYNGEKIVILNPSDSNDISPISMVTADLLKRAGFEVDLQAMDWGTLLQRRTSHATTDKGGWNIFHSTWPSIAIANPVLNTTIRGEGSTGWPGWFESAEMEKLVSDWLYAPSPAEAERLFHSVDALALREMPTVPLGTYFPQTAYRSNLKGVLSGSVRYPWNVQRV